MTLDDRQRIADLPTRLADLGILRCIGNVTAITDPVHPAGDRQFGYDGLNRLTSAQGRWGQGTLSYDALGNLP